MAEETTSNHDNIIATKGTAHIARSDPAADLCYIVKPTQIHPADNEQATKKLGTEVRNTSIRAKPSTGMAIAVARPMRRLSRAAQDWNPILGFFNCLVADQPDRAQPDIGLSPQPGAQLRRFRAGPDQEGLFFPCPGEDAPGKELRQVMVRKQQGDVKPRHEVEEENSRNERVLGRDQVKDECAGAGESLAQTQAMLTEQFVLQEIVFRTVAAERFERHAQDEQSAIDAVASPGPFRAAGGIKRDHDPDAKIEKNRHERDLAEQENSVETLRSLRNHDYSPMPSLRVRDGRVRSTRGKTGTII